MSNNQGYHDSSHGGQPLPTNNPWADQTGSGVTGANLPAYGSAPHETQQQSQQQYGQQQIDAAFGPPRGHPSGQEHSAQQQYGQQQVNTAYAPPSGPPPGQHQHQQQSQPNRAGTFQETDFIPESERGEQREAMEQFEMTKSGNESQTDRDVAQLQREFPGVDGSLIAALYGDNGGLGPTREMLQELAGAGAQGS